MVWYLGTACIWPPHGCLHMSHLKNNLHPVMYGFSSWAWQFMIKRLLGKQFLTLYIHHAILSVYILISDCSVLIMCTRTFSIVSDDYAWVLLSTHVLPPLCIICHYRKSAMYMHPLCVAVHGNVHCITKQWLSTLHLSQYSHMLQ